MCSSPFKGEVRRGMGYLSETPYVQQFHIRIKISLIKGGRGDFHDLPVMKGHANITRDLLLMEMAE